MHDEVQVLQSQLEPKRGDDPGALLRDADAAQRQKFSTTCALKGSASPSTTSAFGYSSLGYLQQLPVDQLKVDRSFVSRVDGGERALAIVRSVVELAHAVGLQVVAEGVENSEQHGTLLAMGCDHAQGCLYSRPLQPDALAQQLSEQSRLACAAVAQSA